MAVVKQNIVLNFETQLEQAKTDILSLADLYKKSMVAPGQEGAPSSEQRFDVEQLVSERARDTGLSPDEFKKVLEDVNQIMAQEVQIRERLAELSTKREETEKKISEREAEKVKLIGEAAELMGLRKDANLKEVIAAKDKLALEIEGGKATKEQIETYNKLNGLLGEVGTKNRSIGQLVRSNTGIITEQTDLYNKQDDIFVKLRQSVYKLNLTEEERGEIEAHLSKILWKQTSQVKELEAAQKKLVVAAKENAKAQDDINRSLKGMPITFAEKATSAFLYYQAVQAIRRVVRAAVRTLTELDKALTDIAIVTNMNRQQTQQLIGTYQDMAKRVGLTTTEVVNLSTAFFRQGRAAEDALQLTETAARFARIAAINVNDAANFLTAAINGFNLAASEATRIIDRFAALGASAAASAQEIAIALSKVAPAAASAGVEIDNLMAFVTKAIETTREAPENIGTAFKTIFARMRELTDIGKVMEDGMDVNRVESALKNIGVDLRDASGEFRNLDQVLIEVGHKWDSITRSQQAYVATTLAGTRQQTRLIALFENFDRTLELIDVSQQSAGAAAIQHAEFMQGLEAATTNLKTSFQEFITSIAKSDQMLFVIDALRVGIDLLNTAFGKLILTGIVYRIVTTAAMNKESKFGKAVAWTTNNLIALSKPMGVSILQSKAHLIARNAETGAILKQATAINILQGAKNKVAGIRMGLIGIMTKSLKALTGETLGSIRLAFSLNKLTAAKLLVAGAAKKMKVAFLAAGKAILAMMAKLLISPLGLILALGSIIIALKKISEATDTTNPTIAEFQIRIKKASAALKEIIEGIKEFFGRIIRGEGILGKFFKVWLSGWKAVFKVLGRLPFIGKLFSAFSDDLTATEKAAAGLVVLTNNVKDLNKEVRETQKTTQQLSSTLERFERLNRQRFRSATETAELNELQADLQRRLKTTSVGFDLVFEARSQVRENQAKIQRLTDEVRDLIQTEFAKNPGVSFSDLMDSDLLTDEMKENIPLLVETFATSFIEGFEDAAPEVQRALLRLLSIDPDAFQRIASQAMIAAEDTAVDLLRMQELNVATSSYTTELREVEVPFKFVIRAGESFDEAFDRSVAEGSTISREMFGQVTSGLFEQQFIDAESMFGLEGPVAQAEELVQTLRGVETPNEFLQAMRELQGMDISLLDEDELGLLFRAVPEFEALRRLTSDEGALLSMFEQGGINFVRNLASTIGDAVSSIQDQFEDEVAIVAVADESVRRGVRFESVVVRGASEIADEFIADLINFIADADDLPTALADLFRDGFQGIDVSEIGLLQLLDFADIGGLRKRIFDDVAETQRVIELSTKNIAELTEDELDFLGSKYPEALVAMRQGLFDAEEFAEAAREKRNEDINNTREAAQDEYRTRKFQLADLLGLSRDMASDELAAAAERAYAEGKITEEQLRQFVVAQQNLLNTEAQLEVLQEVSNREADMTEQLKARYKVQLDLLKAQQDAIKDARTIRDLQQQSNDLAIKSLQATRVGATGSLEARFNQQQLNQEIATMNRTLQDQIMTAQLEAQQKILEDSQQQAIEAATLDNTVATRENTGTQRDLIEKIDEDIETRLRLDREAREARRTSNPVPSRGGGGGGGDELERAAKALG